MALVGSPVGKPWGRRLPVSVGAGPVAKTYAEFQAHIATLATDGIGSWSDNMGFLPYTAKAYRITAAAVAGGLYGSSWDTAFALSAGTFCRVIQHGLPSQGVFNAQIASGFEIFVRTTPVSDQILPAITRNGFTSLDSGTPDGRSTRCDEIIYWDGTQAQRMRPVLGLGPTPYTW